MATGNAAEGTGRRRRQWTVGSMLGAVLLCAVVLGIAVNTRETHEISAEFTALPADDRALAAWLRALPPVRGVEIRRQGNEIEVRYKWRSILPSFGIASPPFEQLGYTGLKRITMRATRPSPLGVLYEGLAAVPLRLWPVLALVATATLFARRRRACNAAGPSSG